MQYWNALTCSWLLTTSFFFYEYFYFPSLAQDFPLDSPGRVPKILLAASLTYFAPKKQPTVARSNTEAEYRSLALAAAELIWLQFRLRELHVPNQNPPILN